jgi:hypothetical protein
MDVPHDKLFETKLICSACIRNKYTDPKFGRSVQTIAEQIQLPLVDSNDKAWQLSLEASNPNVGGNPLPVINANSYSGGNTSLMAPVGDINWTKDFDGMEFSQVKSPTFGHPISKETEMERYTLSNYEDFVLSSWLKQEHENKTDKEKLARTYVVKNLARDADKSVLEVLKLQNDSLEIPYQLDQDWNNNNILMNNVIGNYGIKELPDINGIDGDIQPEGKLKKAILIAGILFLSIDPSSYPAKIIGI